MGMREAFLELMVEQNEGGCFIPGSGYVRGTRQSQGMGGPPAGTHMVL